MNTDVYEPGKTKKQLTTETQRHRGKHRIEE
jgi:hypothetical protein